MPLDHTADLSAAPDRAAGLARLTSFLPNAGSRYASTRNADYGPEDRSNVSVLSPYIRHRLVLEQEVLDAVLGRYALSTAEKFVQEVFWRTYFKGWLERRPSVWTAYRDDVAHWVGELDDSGQLRKRYERAVNGNTGIACFDAWAQELVETGYLHNHTRMWFASIWIFTLDLPWQLGADFFYRHLMDGDPASNTCSWRWVGGLHTKGKTYLARPDNIERYTDGRFAPHGDLAGSAPPLDEPHEHGRKPIPDAAAQLPDGPTVVLITPEDCRAEELFDGLKPAAVVGLRATSERSPLQVGDVAAAFEAGALGDAVDRAREAFG
ncbi:MAG: FAD-binding domain-containing protein, partial [Pseudomonadota bacterium]